MAVKLSDDDKEILIPAAVVGLGMVLAYFMGKENQTFPLSYPVAGRRITSRYGYRIHPMTKKNTFHRGLDLAAAEGEAVYAPADGRVLGLDKSASGGNELLIGHPNGWHTGYAHLSGYAVRAGQSVRRGQLIAYAGSTGSATGPHLHFVVSDSTKLVKDPLLYLAS